MAESKIKKQFGIVNVITKKATTNANGSANLFSIIPSNKIIINVLVDGLKVIPFKADNMWHACVLDTDNTRTFPKPNTEYTFTIYYLD